jgi:hypothetical protein
MYYASCARHKAQYSKPSVPLPKLPDLPHTEWAKITDPTQLFNTIEKDISTLQGQPSNRDEILPILDKMCAHGWVAFRANLRLCRMLWKFNPHKGGQGERRTGDMIVGIVKPFFKKEGSSGENLQRQMQMMILMRNFGWKLREVQPRNWIDGYLVDGADIEIRPLYPRHLERSWTSAFFRLMSQVGECAVEDERQGTVISMKGEKIKMSTSAGRLKSSSRATRCPSVTTIVDKSWLQDSGQQER